MSTIALSILLRTVSFAFRAFFECSLGDLEHVGVGHNGTEIDRAISASGVEHSVEEDTEGTSSLVVNSFRWDQLVVLINHFVFILIII